jgi:hypothetical protein
MCTVFGVWWRWIIDLIVVKSWTVEFEANNKSTSFIFRIGMEFLFKSSCLKCKSSVSFHGSRGLSAIGTNIWGSFDAFNLFLSCAHTCRMKPTFAHVAADIELKVMCLVLKTQMHEYLATIVGLFAHAEQIFSRFHRHIFTVRTTPRSLPLGQPFHSHLYAFAVKTSSTLCATKTKQILSTIATTNWTSIAGLVPI